MNEQLKKFKRGDVVLGKVVKIESSKALIKIEECKLVYIIKEVASRKKIESIEEALQLDKIYKFCIEIDYTGQYYNPGDYYLSIVKLENLILDKRLDQLVEENVTVYSKVIKAFDYGVLVEIENDNFVISNIHLKTKISNQELVEKIIPIKFIVVEIENNNYKYTNIFASHCWALLENLTDQKFYNYGDRVVGKVVKITNDYALIDIGVEKFAYIGLNNISSQAKFCEECIHLGLNREFIISTTYFNQCKTLGLSSRYIDEEIGLKRIKQMHQEDVIFYPQVIEKSRENYIVRVENIRCFLPANHLISNIIENNNQIPLQFLEFDETKCRRVVSNRKALATLKLKQIKIGDVITGKIVKVKEYGLFVVTDNLPVLLHISEVSQVSVTFNDLNNIFQVDDEIKAIVVAMDIKKRRVAVSTKELEREPRDMLKDSQLVYKNAEEMANRYRELVLERLNNIDALN